MRLEGAVAIPEKNRHNACTGRDRQIGISIAVKVAGHKGNRRARDA